MKYPHFVNLLFRKNKIHLNRVLNAAFVLY
jgi:hypothetical protein